VISSRVAIGIHFLLTAVLLLLINACDSPTESGGEPHGMPSQQGFQCDEDNGGISLPEDFCAGVVADSLGFIRHLAVSDAGNLYVSLRNTRLGLGGAMVLRDEDNDGKMELIEKFSDIPGMGIEIHDGFLYRSSDTGVVRYQLTPGKAMPAGDSETVITGLPEQTLHAGKPFVIDDRHNLYINIGSPSNACQLQEQVIRSPGHDPCPELERHAGIWRFSADELNQIFDTHGDRYASGIRNTYAMDWHPVYRKLYVVQHGRDQLYELWPGIYTAERSAQLPAEELLLIEEGRRYGWPYCYYDPVLKRLVLAPEYGGDGIKVGRCENFPLPLVAFPAHYGPNDMVFYNASQFPRRYQNGAFIAFHGSYNRGPFEQVGYQVVFLPFENGLPSGDWEVFADEFAGKGPVRQPEDAEYRPTGLAVGPEGSLFISDSVQGRIWRVVYRGEADSSYSSDG